MHTPLTLRYGEPYYQQPTAVSTSTKNAIRSTRTSPYLASTIGMTFHASDTDIRATILRHMSLSDLFGVIIIAISVNLIVGIAG